ncbi:MAG: transposase [Nitrospirae bacterium]|nr:transposase [Nitrospirota bacterium]
MARPLRIQYQGAVYHITCRGNERKEIFRDNVDRKSFLDILKRSIETYSIKLYAYILMENHFHLLSETPLGNLNEFMRQFNIIYTGYYNRRHTRVGHLFQGRYKGILVDKDNYLSLVSRYIHLNPIRTKGMERRGVKENIQFLRGYRWSSLGGYIDKERREDFIDYSVVLGEYGGVTDKGREAYRRKIGGDIAEGLEIRDKVVGQSIIGGDRFIEWIRERILKKVKGRRELPAVRGLQRYKAKEEIIRAIEEVTGRRISNIINEGGSLRQIVMDILYRVGGLKGVEIGEMMGLDYSTISQGRKRLNEKIQKDRNLRVLLNRIENRLSI